LGREPAVVDQPLPDRRISRLHCRIVEDGASGGYRIYDEGSGSGTYVNEEEVGHTGTALSPEDIITIGPVQYRYEGSGIPRLNQQLARTQVMDDDENTVPYIRTPPSNRT
jgi:predicted component of type VI protein secretion system